MLHEKVGRFIGATGAACASAIWGFLVFAALALLIEPHAGWRGLVVIIAMPMGALAAMFLVASVATVIILAKRADTSMPWRIATTHVVMAALGLWWGGPGIAVFALLAIAATQLIAIRLLQTTPSHASSQR
jgi:hypothetical protein